MRRIAESEIARHNYKLGINDDDPVEFLRKHLGYDEASFVFDEGIMRHRTPFALTAVEIDVIGKPVYKCLEHASADKPFTFHLVCVPVPDFELESYDPVSLTLPTQQVKSAEIEEEISELDDDERKMFLEDLGLKESGLEKLVKASYHLLGLMSFLTSGEDETRAWTIKIGTKAPQAAGKIHSDFERGFIKAEVVNYQDLLDCGSYAGAREKGLVRMEGKDYVVQDGDVILFRFNV